MSNQTPKALHSIDEAAQIMGIGKTLLYQEINQGRLIAKKIGRRTLIPAQAIHTWVENLPAIHS